MLMYPKRKPTIKHHVLPKLITSITLLALKTYSVAKAKPA